MISYSTATPYEDIRRLWELLEPHTFQVWVSENFTPGYVMLRDLRPKPGDWWSGGDKTTHALYLHPTDLETITSVLTKAGVEWYMGVTLY